MGAGVMTFVTHCASPTLSGKIFFCFFKVITEPTKWDVTPDTLVALSSLSYSGVVSHVVLRANGKAKPANYENNYPIPYLILMSGRNEGIVEKSLKKVCY